MMRKDALTLTMILFAGVALVAQQAAKPAATHEVAAKAPKMSAAAKIKKALSAGPADITKNAAVVDRSLKKPR